MKIYVIGAESDYIRFLWKDSIDFGNVKFISFKYPKNIIYKFLFSKKVNVLFNPPFKFLFRKKNMSFFKDLNKKDDNVVIFSDLIPLYFDYRLLKKIKTELNTTFAFLFMNDLQSMLGNNQVRIKKVLNRLPSNLLFTFDKKDSIAYNIHHFVGIYPSSISLSNSCQTEYDFFFIGKRKNRKEKITQVYSKLIKDGFKCLFIVNGLNENETMPHGIICNQQMSYNQIVDLINKSKCIVDLKESTQTGISLRYFESLSFSKKLLTDNLEIKNEKFYNPDNMMCFEKPGEIDYSFLLKKSPCLYHGEYSSRNLIEDIIKIKEEIK
jgi:hypothetical protein